MYRIARRVVNKNLELKERFYTYLAVGVDPIGGGALSFNSVSYGTAAIITQLCRGINRGTNDGERIGHKIKVKGVYFFFDVVAATPSEVNQFRLLVIRPKGQFSTTSVAALTQQIFSNNGSSVYQWAMPVDTDFFDVYYDKKVSLESFDSGGTGYQKHYHIKKLIKFPKGMQMQWAESDVQPFRDIFLVAISDSAVVAHPGAVAGYVKVYFTDA